MQREEDLQGVFVKSVIVLNLKGGVLEFLENRRS